MSLPVQGVAVLIVLVILSATAIGVPAIWLIRDRLDLQAWALVAQGSRMTEVLIDSRLSELNNLAILTAQRPTLSELLALGDRDRLVDYLETLRVGADLDLVMLCFSEGEPPIAVGLPAPSQACESSFMQNSMFGWLRASQPVLNWPSVVVVAGQAIDAGFLDELRGQTGLEQFFLLDGDFMAASISDSPELRESILSITFENTGSGSNPANQGVFSLDDTPYYAARMGYGDSGLETIVALPVTDILAAQERMSWTVGGGILIVVLLCSGVGIYLARRVSLPLERLRESAMTLRKGDLATPVVAGTRVREIAEVSYALEDARIALQHSVAELRQEKAWVDHLLESVVEGIVTLDRRGRITFFSRGAERITGLEHEGILGKPVDEVFLLSERDERFSQRIPSSGGKPEILVAVVNGRPITLEITGAKLAPPEAGQASLALFLRDVSNEEAIRRLLGDFLANVTHEFRTPLTALAVSIELLLDQLPDLTTDELRELLSSHHLGVLGLQTLIDNLLEGASIEAGRFRLSPRPVELAEVIRESLRTMQPLLEVNGLKLRLELPDDLPLVKADSRRTGQVLVNLLSNAVKWGPGGSEILLSATRHEGEVKILVSDRGPGIPAERKVDLFFRFDQVQSNAGNVDRGTGLGLSVVKAIVEAQQGRVGVEDREEGGSIFWFTIPIVEMDTAD